MATATLVPSTYYLSSTYLTMTDAENMYTPVSSTTYASMTNTNASTSYYYCYIRGFNFSDIPGNALVSSFTVRLRGRASGAYNSAMYLCNGTSTITNATATQIPNSSSAATRTFANGNLTWNDIRGYGANFGIRINCRRNAKNTQSYYYIYGAEIEVTYQVPTPIANKVYLKEGAWGESSRAYKKVSGVWVQQIDIANLFDPTVNYKIDLDH